MATILIPLPADGFDPTESSVPWRLLTGRGHTIVFATPNARPAVADPLMATGKGLGLLAPVLRANADGRAAYAAMRESAAFNAPIAWDDAQPEDFDALLLPGGHAKGMRPYLESAVLQALVVSFMTANKPLGAICHGVVLAARAKLPSGYSVLYGRKTTALTKQMEMTAWRLTALYLGDYYRTYPMTVEDEVKGVLAGPADFLCGPSSFSRDSERKPQIGFTVEDGNYLSARWPGDAHRFAIAFDAMLRRRAI